MSLQDGPHPWQSSWTTFTANVLPRLVEHGIIIGVRAGQGDELSKKITDGYARLCKSYDPMTAIIIEKNLDEWERLNGLATSDGAGTHPATRQAGD